MTTLESRLDSELAPSRAEVKVRKRLEEVIGPLTDLLRSYAPLAPGATAEDLEDTFSELRALQDLLEEVAQLVCDLEQVPHLSTDGARFAGAARAGMWLLDAARATITAELDSNSDTG